MLLLKSRRCRSYYLSMYQQQEDLKIALLKLSQTILNRDEEDHQSLAELLLLDVDRASFSKLIEKYGCSSLSSLKRLLSEYYQRKRGEQIRWQSEVIRRYDEDQLIIAAIFALDLALLDNKKTYIESIISLGEEQQTILQPFVQIITIREQFIISKANTEEEDHSRQHLLELADQNEKLKLEREHWMQLYQELKENYDYLKATHDKTSEELNYLKQERFMLINELGGTECGSVEETIDRVKREFENYEKTIEKHQKEIEQKKSVLRAKIDELQRFELTFKSNKYEERVLQLQQMRRQLKEAQNQLSESKVREQQLRADLCKTDQLLISKEEQCSRLRQQIETLEIYQSKYLSIRKLHNQFKVKLVKNMKQID